MVVKYSRAQRRHDRARMQKRTKEIQKSWYSISPPDEESLHISTGKFRDNLAKCSCWMCRGARHNHCLSPKERITIQERKARDATKDGYEELL